MKQKRNKMWKRMFSMLLVMAMELMKQKRNKMWKRMFSMLLVMAMLITAIPVETKCGKECLVCFWLWRC